MPQILGLDRLADWESHMISVMSLDNIPPTDIALYDNDDALALLDVIASPDDDSAPSTPPPPAASDNNSEMTRLTSLNDHVIQSDKDVITLGVVDPFPGSPTFINAVIMTIGNPFPCPYSILHNYLL